MTSVVRKMGGAVSVDGGEFTVVTPEMVHNEAARRLNALQSPYADGEALTWGRQEQEALAYDANPEAPTPYLDQIKRDDESMADLVAAILGNAELFDPISAAIIKARREIMAFDPLPADYADNSRWP